jgi:aquaporin Z
MGRQSGAHLNPAMTLTFLRLGKVAPADAMFYVVAQFAGGIAGTLLLSALLSGCFTLPPISAVATLPGRPR